MMKVITQRPGAGRSPPIPRVRARARATPRPRTHGAIVGHVGSFPDLIPHIPADRTATGVRVKTARAAAKMPFRSAIRLAYSLHMRCRDLPWTDTSAVRSLTHTEQRNRCGLAALSGLATRHGPHASRSRARPPDCGSTSDKPAPMPNIPRSP